MPQNPNYVPTKLADLGPWADNLNTLISANPTNYGLVAGDATAIDTAVDPFLAALTLSTNPATRTPVTVNATQAAKDAMLAVVRPYAVQISQNPLISGALKTGVGVTDRILTKTRNSVVSAVALVSMEFALSGAPTFRVVDPATPDSKARPLGALSWEYQLQSRLSSTGEWVNEPGGTSSKPILTLNPAGFDPDPFYRMRTRWVGAFLPGLAPNVGPWSAWQEFVFPAP